MRLAMVAMFVMGCGTAASTPDAAPVAVVDAGVMLDSQQAEFLCRHVVAPAFCDAQDKCRHAQSVAACLDAFAFYHCIPVGIDGLPCDTVDPQHHPCVGVPEAALTDGSARDCAAEWTMRGEDCQRWNADNYFASNAPTCAELGH